MSRSFVRRWLSEKVFLLVLVNVVDDIPVVSTHDVWEPLEVDFLSPRRGVNVKAISSKWKSNSASVVYEPVSLPCVRGRVVKLLNVIGCAAGFAACIMAVVVGIAL